jgi:hypothetical protein
LARGVRRLDDFFGRFRDFGCGEAQFDDGRGLFARFAEHFGMVSKARDDRNACKQYSEAQNQTHVGRNRRHGHRRPSCFSASIHFERRAIQDDARRKGEVGGGREDVSVVDFHGELAVDLPRGRDLERCLRRIGFCASQGCKNNK